MKTMESARATVVTSALALVAWPKTSWAQSVVGPQVPGSAPSEAAQSGVVTTAVVVASLLGVLVVLGALIKMLDLKRKRDTEAVAVQARISDAVLRDPRLFNLPITPTAHVPLWKGTPVIVEVTGQVPSEDLRQAAIHLIEREASQLGPEVRIESKIGIEPTLTRRSA
jgi:hypothetical protein